MQRAFQHAVQNPRVVVAVLALCLLALGSIFAVVRLAAAERSASVRCPPGMQAIAGRCCGIGQRLDDGRCAGKPLRCSTGMRVQTELGIGCVMMNRRIRYDGGLLELSPADWEAEGIVRARRVEVAPFELDSLEITVNRWKTCVAAGMCRARDNAVEPGRALANLSSEEAERFCGFMGGRLPTSDEWLFASSRGGTRRYAWGQTGLVCRRAAFGLVDGPCASGAAGPELAGARPDGVSPEGAFDLAGNLAEWARQPEGRMVARGGSFRSRAAAELKSWSFERAVAGAPHIGARCAYDVNHRSHTD